MSFSKKLAFVVVLVMIVPLILSACGATPEPQVIIETVPVEVTTIVEKEGEVVTVIETQVVEVEKTVEVVVEATPEPVERTGAWLDRIIMVEEESQEAAVTRLQSGDIDVFAFSADSPNVFETVKADANLEYTTNFGSYNELTINPVPEFTDGRLNPFGSPKIREALNWLIDRDYIIQEITGGLGIAKLLPINSNFPDAARYIAKMRELQTKYAYDPEKAAEAIAAEMEGMGAELVDGKWAYNGQPVTIIMIIRTEDSRMQIGDYVGTQLETAGFTVDRQYKTRTEASPIWVQSNPAEGQWHIYTGGWITQIIDRDASEDFAFFYLPYDYPIPLHQAYTPSAEFDEVAMALRNTDFSTMEERDELFERAMELALEDSVRVWLNDQTSFTPYRSELSVTGDLAGGVSGGYQWPWLIRFDDQVGGTARIAQPGLLVDPWNPVAGSNWVYDGMVQRATEDQGFMYDPFTGLVWPHRVERAEVVVQEGLPVVSSLDWVDLSFEAEIAVPDDAWVDWDAENQTWITAGEFYTTPATALTKATVYYPEDLYETVKWHDGSPISAADFVMSMIMLYDPAKPESALYDEAAASNLQAWFGHFKGMRIVSTDPLAIETYDDLWTIDAELIPTSWFPADLNSGYPYGTAGWHNMALGVLAEANGELAMSADKADAAELEWMSYISGPSLQILKKYLDQSVEEGYIPYASVMSDYVTADEVAERWANLKDWYAIQGHFWIGTGPYYLDKVFPVEGTLTLERFEDYPDPADRWAMFAEPKVGAVEMDGPGQVTIGQEAAFDVFVDFEGEPYPQDEIAQAKYLLFDATGALVASGDAEAVADGQYVVTLPADVTSKLTAGSNRLEVAVSSSVVSIPFFGAIDFVTVQ